MVSNAAQLLIDEAIERGSNLHDLADYAYVQINDTHPSMVIPELIRLLTEKHGIEFAEAVAIVKNMTGYTNHTILAEALENGHLSSLKWCRTWLILSKNWMPLFVQKLKTQQSKSLMNQVVYMAHMDIHFSNSVNGVAASHRNPQNSELKAFYELYPEKFNNKTNGITFRRWLNLPTKTSLTTSKN